MKERGLRQGLDLRWAGVQLLGVSRLGAMMRVIRFEGRGMLLRCLDS